MFCLKKRKKKKERKKNHLDFHFTHFRVSVFFFFIQIFFFLHSLPFFFQMFKSFFFEFFSFGTNVALLLAQLVNALSWETAGRRFKSKKTTLFHQKQAKPIQSINISNSPYTSLQNIIFNMSSLLFIIYI